MSAAGWFPDPGRGVTPAFGPRPRFRPGPGLLVAFYTREIPRRFPSLQCRFTTPLLDGSVTFGDECALREDVEYGEIDVWFAKGDLSPGEVLIRLSLGS